MPNPAPTARTIAVPSLLYRQAQVGSDGSMSISSDTPCLRYDFWTDERFYEVIGHGPGDFDETRLRAGLPLLFNHNQNQHLGRAMKYSCNGKRITCSEHVWSEDEFAKGKKKDMERGVLVDTSVAYTLIDDGICIGELDGLPIYKFKWDPHEHSLVVIPADPTVGVGRSRGIKEQLIRDGIIPAIMSINIRDNDVDNLQQSDHNQPTKPNTTDSMKLREQARTHFFNKPDDAGGGGGAAAPTVDPEAERLKGEEHYKLRCKRIREFVKNVANPTWKDIAEKIAEKHIDGKADYQQFFEECTREFTTPEISILSEPDLSEGQGKSMSIGAQFIRDKNVLAVQSNSRGRLGRGVALAVDIPMGRMLGPKSRALAARAGFTSADLAAVNVTVDQNILALGIQRLTIMDVIGSGTIGSAAYKYARENGFGSIDGVAVAAGKMPRAKTVGERGLKPNWDADLSTETANVAKVAITTKVPDEFLADFPSAMSYIDDRLPFMVDTETEFQILYGDGLNDNLKGIFTTSGVQTRAVPAYTPGTDDYKIAQALLQGLTDISVGAQFEPDFFGFHPYDWETARLLRDTTGRFLAGGPFYIPLTSTSFQEVYTFWGKPVVKTTAITYGSPIAGAGKIGAAALIRDGMRIEMTNSNEDDFKRNLICLRAEHRLAVPVYRPVCFLEFTGFPARNA